MYLFSLNLLFYLFDNAKRGNMRYSVLQETGPYKQGGHNSGRYINRGSSKSNGPLVSATGESCEGFLIENLVKN